MDLNKGIDEQVSNRVDAYRGNPQQLMKMYQQNQELVDLLALQKLKSEKDAAKRQIEMQMQQQPGTVKQQREQELMQMTKDDLAKQTQGVLQRKQQQQQANLQRAAKSGLAAIAPRRPAPVPAQTPKPMMAGGGIVAFQPGGSVSTSPLGRQVSAGLEAIGENTDRQKLETRVRTLYGKYGAPQGVFRRQSDRARSQAKEILDRVNAGSLSNQQLQMLINQFPQFQESVKQTVPSGPAINVDEMVGQGVERATAKYKVPDQAVTMDRNAFASPTAGGSGGVRRGYTDPSNYFTLPEDIRSAIPLDKRNATYVSDTGPKVKPINTNAMAGAGALPADPTGGIGGFNMDTGIAALTTPKVAAAPATKTEAETTAVDDAMAAVNTQMAGLPAISGGGMGGAEAALMRGVGIGEDVLGRGEKAARFAQMEADLAALDEELYDPEAERRQQLQAFLIGTAGATNVGYAMAGGAAAAINLENRQKKNRRQRMVDRIALGERGMSMDTDIGKAALTLGNQMFADFNANQRAAMSAAATLSAAQLRATSEAARLEFDKQKESNNQEYKLRDLDIREASNAIEQARNESLDKDRRITGILTATNNLLKISTDAYEQGAKLFGLEEANMALALLSPNDDGYEAAKAARDLARAEADAYATEFLELKGVNTKLEELYQQHYELTGVEGMPGINPDDITDVQPKR